MTVYVRNLQRRYDVKPRQIRNWTMSILTAMNLQRAQMGLLLVTDRRMQRLNRLYRGINRSTNVLSFCIDSSPPKGDGPHLLGDVVISVETAAREARRGRLSLQERLMVLLVHGILHLAGLDHERSVQESKRMAREEKRLLRMIGAVRGGLIREEQSIHQAGGVF
jgi:probable rRNA maturation factor